MGKHNLLFTSRTSSHLAHSSYWIELVNGYYGLVPDLE